MSRMTHDERTIFVNKVMKSIPRKCAMDPSAVIAELEKRYSTKVPADVKAFMKKYPGCVYAVNPELKGFPQYHVKTDGAKVTGATSTRR